jgi:Flp pilus assembly protein TadG
MSPAAGFDHSGRHRRRGRGDHGTAVVEFALVLPFLAVLALGTVDLGRAFQLKNRLTNAAREGAVYGQFHPCDTAEIQRAVDDEDPKISALNGYSRTVSVSGCPNTPAGNLTVTASSTMTVLTPFVSAITGKTVTVSGKSTVAVQ